MNIIENEQKLIDEAKKIDWKHWVDRPYSPIMVTLNMVSADSLLYKKAGFDTEGFGYESSLYQHPVFYYPSKLEERNTTALETFLKSKTIFDISRSLGELHKKNKVEIAKLIQSNAKPTEKLAGVADVLRSYSPFLWLNISLEKHYQERIDNEVSKYITGDVKQFVGEVSMSSNKNVYGLMLEMLEK